MFFLGHLVLSRMVVGAEASVDGVLVSGIPPSLCLPVQWETSLCSSVMYLQFVPKSHLFFTAGKDHKIKQWDADKFQHIQTLEVRDVGWWLSLGGGYFCWASIFPSWAGGAGVGCSVRSFCLSLHLSDF